MTATPDFSIRMQVAGMRGLLSEIIAVGALSKHGDADLMERVREAADTPLPELPARQCLAQIEEPAAPAAVAGPAWDKTRDSLATLLLGLARRPFLDFDVACIALDAATEPDMPLAYMRGAPAAPALEAPAAPTAPAPKFDLRTSAGGRGYVAWHFANVLKRHDFHNYIHNTLAADFACALARALETPEAQGATDDAIDAIVLRQTGFDGDGYQAMTADELRRIVRSALDELAAAPQAPAAPLVLGWVHRSPKGHIGNHFYTYEPHCDTAVRDGGGENIAVIAAHEAAPAAPAVDASDTALLDAMERERIALVPEFEGPWDAELYEEGEEPRHIGSGATPREALRAAIAAQAAAKGF